MLIVFTANHKGQRTVKHSGPGQTVFQQEDPDCDVKLLFYYYINISHVGELKARMQIPFSKHLCATFLCVQHGCALNLMNRDNSFN